ncbi:MAG TPA: gamma-glutamyltransferase [Rubrobacter sp.]|nr:gamma-glutamyltransferase [Rubrobacter sp.]
MSQRLEGATRRPDLGGRSTVFGTKGAVACEHPGAAIIGLRVLDGGGTAADACVAMAAAMAVLSPMQTGMGGDAFLLFYEAETGRVTGVNGSGRASRDLTVAKLSHLGELPERGGLTVTVPGAVRLWEDAVYRFGNQPLARLLEPAWELAENGYPVGEVIARYWDEHEEVLRTNDAATRTFLPEGRAPVAGEIFSQVDLAATISAVAERGADAFYEGEIAASIARSTQEAGGYLSEEDLAAHESTFVEPISTDYRGVRVYEMPPPGQGVAALEMLNILEGFDLASMEPSGAERIHLEVEAKKLAFEDLHGRIGDPEFSEIQTEELLSKEYAAKLRGSISSDAAAVISPPDPGGDTTYICAVDAEGNGCSFINSLYKGFGSGIVAEGTGVCLHNRGNSFRLEPGHPNAIAPGKRPMHTLIPGLVSSDGALWAVFGVMGAAMQPQGHAQVLVDLLDYDMDPQAAVEHPRHRHENGVLLIEGRVPEEEIASLRGRGHRIEVREDFMIPAGGAQLIRILDNGVRACGSDPRKDGCALAQ